MLREELRPERGAAQPMETRGVVARYDASLDQLTIWDTTQAPVAARGVIAEKLGMPEAAITVIAPDVGGGFGVKIFLVYPEELLIPFAARLLGRPVKWIEDRREHFIGSNHERLMVHRIEVAATKDGHILGIRDHFLYDSGAYCPYGPINAQCAQAILPGPYKIPAVHTEYEAVYTNTPVVSPYRGAGQPHGNFVMEAAMNHVARALGLDAAEIRRRNLVRPEDCPWDSGRIFQGNTPLIHRDSDYPAQLAKTLDALDYAGVKRSQPAAREQGIFRGVGIAFFVEGTGISPYEGVEVRVEPTGHVHVTTGYPSQGQGHHTTLAQVVAETLSVAPEQVVVESGRSDRFAWGVGTFASRSAVIGGSAALGAARAVRARALNLASDELEAAPEDLVLADGAVHVKGAPQMAVTLAALARAADPINTLESGTEPGPPRRRLLPLSRRRVRERSPRADRGRGCRHGHGRDREIRGGPRLRRDDQPHHRRGPDPGRHGAGDRRRVLREAQVRRGGPAAGHDLHGLPDPDGHGDPADRDYSHGEPLQPESLGRQGCGRGRRDPGRRGLRRRRGGRTGALRRDRPRRPPRPARRAGPDRGAEWGQHGMTLVKPANDGQHSGEERVF